MIKTILLSVAAGALLTTVAAAAPIQAGSAGATAPVSAEHVRMICNESGRCWRSGGGGPRYVQRGYREGYGRGYERRGYRGDSDRGGPSIGLSFGNRGW